MFLVVFIFILFLFFTDFYAIPPTAGHVRGPVLEHLLPTYIFILLIHVTLSSCPFLPTNSAPPIHTTSLMGPSITLTTHNNLVNPQPMLDNLLSID
jgi:hypothetical protein